MDDDKHKFTEGGVGSGIGAIAWGYTIGLSFSNVPKIC
jgi:hypothetical protein